MYFVEPETEIPLDQIVRSVPVRKGRVFGFIFENSCIIPSLFETPDRHNSALYFGNFCINSS